MANSRTRERGGAELAGAHTMVNIETFRRLKRLGLKTLNQLGTYRPIAVGTWSSPSTAFGPLAVHVPQAALRQPGLLMGSSTEASSKKISAQELESQLIQSSGYFADAKLRCEPTTAGWDYICSYTPTDQTPFLRLHFGVNVDSTRVLQISPTVPFGVPIPPLGL
jgi:hypothetical protein